MSDANESRDNRESGFRKLAVGGALLGLGLFCVYIANERTHTSDVLDAVPADAFLVASADMERLHRSPIYDAIFGGDGSRSLGLTSVEQACGFDPVKRVTKIAFVVPEEGDHGEFGIAAKVDVTPDEIKACAAKISESGGSDSEPKKQGDFYIIEGHGASLPRLAYKAEGERRGLLLVGKGTIVDTMIDVYEGRKPRISSSKLHASLRSALSKSPEPAVLFTSVLPESTRARIRTEMAGDLAHGSPDAMEMMSGVLAVDTAGAALVAGETDGIAEIRIDLTCERPEACASVKMLLEKKKAEFQRNLGIRLVAGPLLESFAVEDSGTSLYAHASARSGELAKMIERGLAWRKRSRDARDDSDSNDARPEPTSPPLAPRPPDEILNALRDAGAQAHARDAGRAQLVAPSVAPLVAPSAFKPK